MHAAPQAPNTSETTPVQSHQPTVGIVRTEIRVKGRAVFLPSAEIAGRTVIVAGRLLKIASLQDEELVEGDPVAQPALFVGRLREANLGADIFTFSQRLPDTTPKHPYRYEWENYAVIPITTYSEWWNKRVEPSVRRAVRKATKSGVVVKPAQFDDTFVQGIVDINNETPIRQGRRFWHFQKSFDLVKLENSTYAERNTFLGAYYQDELIGYVRLTSSGGVAHLLQILTKMKHFDKRPANALIAKAVEICEQMGISYLMYANYVYNDPKSSLTEFKRRCGFEKALLPRYYVPLTLKGRLALKLGFHRGLAKCIPGPIVAQLLRLRSLWYARGLKGAEGPL